MGKKHVVELLVPGGEATAGPPIGPALGPLGVNVKLIVDKINELTKEYKGMRVPVKVTVDLDTKAFEVEVGIPTTSALIAKEANVEKGSSKPGQEFVGNLSFEQILKISKIVNQKLGLDDLKKVVLQVVGSCVSMGIKIDNLDPRVVTKKIKSGEYDKLIYGRGE
ncbi:MAG: 50S ribosomal protein L11 [Candidatus Geothermarchaeota archaeon]